MKIISWILILLLSMISFHSCTDLLEPHPFEETADEEYLWSTPSYAEGVLMQAFQDLHPSSWRVASNEMMAVLTDDAVSSNLSSLPGNFAMGLQSPYYNLNYLDTWDLDYENLYYINEFLEHIGSTKYDPDSITNQRFINKYRGDAFFIRAWYHWKLLKRFGGMSGEDVMGIPIVRKVITLEESYDLPRNTYMETVNAIIEDCESALKYVPDQYTGDDLVSGVQYYGAPTKSVVKSLMGIVYTYAASPAYNLNNNIDLWDSAASKLSQVIMMLDGAPNTAALIQKNFHDPENTHVIWRPAYQESNYNNEIYNYPPSLRGNGYTNPSQNLVDAFPDNLGYPISESKIYDPANPYLNRDKRFYESIVYNGSIIGLDSSIIETFTGGKDSRAIFSESGTRTGYYLKKLLSLHVTLYPEQKGVEPTFYVAISKTDIYLLYAEAMNELAGPYDSRYGLSARNALLKIRKRAGIVSDQYLLLTASKGKEAFRELIRNERRVELCFEDHRYWDLRRWGEIEKLNNDVYGITILKETDSTFTYNLKLIESRKYKSIYNPLPYEEVLRMKNLTQNEGW
ncbi:MAG: RagB/SusD family nutrient uptake outer membrane protein [Bacteroidales bacterium]|nr:RagB/SusD family nutrient uptake outer membrane protein [Bacteroidales bacterium]MCF8389566.1 RagB/SusD family nutrient uptake outer membrane protein [Bacteroidales bacterium]